MNDSIADSFVLGINTFLEGIVIVAFVGIMTTIGVLNATVAEQQTVSAKMQEYNEYSEFNREHVYPQDIVSTVFKYRGQPIIHVESASGVYSWIAGDPTLEYSTSVISSKFNMNCVYDAFIEKDANGSVTKLIFKECADPTGTGCGLN